MFPYLRRPDPSHQPSHPVYGPALFSSTLQPLSLQETPVTQDRLMRRLDQMSRQIHRSLQRLPGGYGSHSPQRSDRERLGLQFERKYTDVTPSRKLLSQHTRHPEGSRSDSQWKRRVWVFRRVKGGKGVLRDKDLQEKLGRIEKAFT